MHLHLYQIRARLVRAGWAFERADDRVRLLAAMGACAVVLAACAPLVRPVGDGCPRGYYATPGPRAYLVECRPVTR